MKKESATESLNQLIIKLKEATTFKKIKYIIAILFIYITLNFAYDMIMGTLSENWIETDGIIIKTTGRSGHGKSKEIVTEKYEIKGPGSYNSIKYEYAVNGKKYISSRVSYPHTEYSGQKGEAIKVYFWEKLPNFSVIIKGNKMDISTIILYCVFLIISISVIILDPSNEKSG